MLLQNLQYLFISVIVSAVIYPPLINLLYKFQFREKIRELGPESHQAKVGTPKMGGIGFTLITLLLNLLLNSNFKNALLLFIGLFVAAIYGFVEDWFNTYGQSKFRKKVRIEVYDIFSKSKKTWVLYRYLLVPWNLFREFTRVIGSNPTNSGVKLKSHYKVLLHLALGAFIGFFAYFQLGWDSVLIPFFGELTLGLFYPFFITVFFLFSLNAVAITDGLDGLLTGLTLLMLIPFWVIALLIGSTGISSFVAIFVGSLVVYLYFNIYPARVFMGDVGSYAIGAVLFLIPLLLRVEILMFVIYAIAFFDGGISGVAQQVSMKFRKKRIFKMAPVHHHFEMLGWPETKVTNRFWVLQILFSLLGLLLYFYM